MFADSQIILLFRGTPVFLSYIFSLPHPYLMGSLLIRKVYDHCINSQL